MHSEMCFDGKEEGQEKILLVCCCCATSLLFFTLSFETWCLIPSSFRSSLSMKMILLPWLPSDLCSLPLKILSVFWTPSINPQALPSTACCFSYSCILFIHLKMEEVHSCNTTSEWSKAWCESKKKKKENERREEEKKYRKEEKEGEGASCMTSIVSFSQCFLQSFLQSFSQSFSQSLLVVPETPAVSATGKERHERGEMKEPELLQ